MSEAWKLAERKTPTDKEMRKEMVTKVPFSSGRLNSPEFICGQQRKINIFKGQCSKLGSCSETPCFSEEISLHPLTRAGFRGICPHYFWAIPLKHVIQNSINIHLQSLCRQMCLHFQGGVFSFD